MKITTKAFELTKSAYVNLNLRLMWLRLRRRWWVFGFLFVGVALVTRWGHSASVWDLLMTSFFPILAGVLAGLLVAVVFTLGCSWLVVRSKDNAAFFQQRYCEVEDDSLTIYMANGNLSKIQLGTILRVQDMAGWYLLYLAKSFFLFVPHRAFASEDDRRAFESLLRTKGLLSGGR